MTISVDKARELLAQPPTDDTARALKAWRAQEGYSQSEAAIRLGVPVRTLQGWESGRPMPYPSLLQRAVNISTRPADRYSLVQSDFPREFAEFIDFVGATEFDAALRRVGQKLDAVSPSAQSLFGDRFFFHRQCINFVHGPVPFHLDIADPVAVQAASIVAGINRMKRSLTSHGASRLRSMVIDNLRPDRDIRQIEHEIRCSTHFGQKGFDVRFADLEGLGTFDLLVRTPAGSVDVECKTITEDTGSQIKTELTVNLTEIFRKSVLMQPPVDESGLFVLTLKKPSAHCTNLGHLLEEALRSSTPRSYFASSFSLEFSPRPLWQALLNADRLPDLKNQILADPDIDGHARCAIRGVDKIVGLVIRPHKRTTLSRRVVEVIKQGADQCTGKRASVVWLHFVGLAEEDFLALAEFSMDGKGSGLNAIVANAFSPSASQTDRSHVQAVRFSATGRALHSHPALDRNLLMTRAISAGGAIYNVPNSFCRFPEIPDF
ncbi:MAG: helix-turn-helix domain-containing protein [Beijerinckiaceae bacterium]